ncbi:hypothetical protein RhiirA4_488606 [Rhizophagus irregularis]|uniref:Uncharacterized protein n=1 Tax=Rhizophagus irregularis TaxID=588596 RepID=A0A2I1HTV7_9GLOM|nr:hypothetical protein RhiirA4_488606 [Rhizophagus irregularis]
MIHSRKKHGKIKHGLDFLQRKGWRGMMMIDDEALLKINYKRTSYILKIISFNTELFILEVLFLTVQKIFKNMTISWATRCVYP